MKKDKAIIEEMIVEVVKVYDMLKLQNGISEVTLGENEFAILSTFKNNDGYISSIIIDRSGYIIAEVVDEFGDQLAYGLYQVISVLLDIFNYTEAQIYELLDPLTWITPEDIKKNIVRSSK